MARQPRITTVDIPGGTRLGLLHLPASGAPGWEPKSVLYIHGATFPSRLSVGFRFDGLSWMDDLAAAGHDVWALDFRGYGSSDRYPPAPGQDIGPYCRTSDASEQIGHAVDTVLRHDGVDRLSLIAHSWGSMPAARFAGDRADLLDRLVLFGPIAQRSSQTDPEALPPIRQVTLQEQFERFTADVPAGHPPVLELDSFADWGECYLDSDPDSRRRDPQSVAVPSGPAADIRAAWSGRLPYDPGRILAPTLIVRGAWDSLCNDADARWLMDGLRACKTKQDVTIAEATHLMHLEKNRFALYQATRDFLRVRCRPPVAPRPVSGRCDPHAG